jgi:Family of unknown function (DUF6525)
MMEIPVTMKLRSTKNAGVICSGALPTSRRPCPSDDLGATVAGRVMSNSQGSYPTTPKLAMAAFDKLPPLARRSLADAAFDWVPQQQLTRHRRGYEDRWIAEHIAQIDRNAHERAVKRGLVAPVPRGQSLALKAPPLPLPFTEARLEA